MIRWISIILISLIGIIVSFIIYLSTYGIETKSLNNLIRHEVKNYNQNLVLKFTKVKLLLDIKKLNLKAKLIQPKLILENNELIFDKINSNISLMSYLKKEFAIQNLQIKLSKVKLNKFLKFVRIEYPSPFLFVLNQSIKKGNIDLQTELFFNKQGNLMKNYEIKGNIANLGATIVDKHKAENINLSFKIKENIYEFNINDTQLFGIDFKSTKINFDGKEFSDLNVSIDTIISGNINNVDEFLRFFDYDLNTNLSDLNFNLNNKINFHVKKFIKFQNLQIEGKGSVNKVKLLYDDVNKYKKYIKINKIIELQNNQINYLYKKNNFKLETLGNIKLNEKFEHFISKTTFDIENNSTAFDYDLDLDSSSIKIDNLNYDKPANKKSNLKISGIFDKNKLVVKNLNYSESKNNILIKNLHLNNKYQVNNFDQILVNTLKDNIVINNFNAKKNENKISVSGNKFEATYFLKKLNKDNKRKTFSKEFSGNIDFKVKEIIINKESLFNFSGLGQIQEGKLHKLTAKANFSDNEILDISITPVSLNKKKLFIFSDRAKLFLEDYKFIKGFSGGKLEYTSNYDNKASKSNLKIYDFKVKNVPVLAKILTLASLQGIADLLTGEGIRFDEFDMNFNTVGTKIEINDIYAIGPSISLLMNGYIEKKKMVSLSGTLVPASTLNKIVSSIPLVGDILVGSKLGEGVFGVSFKIKGPPKDLKTIVNPIKTLTPRFITRTLKKIKGE